MRPDRKPRWVATNVARWSASSRRQDGFILARILLRFAGATGSVRGFTLQQPPFSGDAPAVASGTATVLRHDAMARHHEADRIRGAGAGHRPRRTRLPQGRGDL